MADSLQCDALAIRKERLRRAGLDTGCGVRVGFHPASGGTTNPASGPLLRLTTVCPSTPPPHPQTLTETIMKRNWKMVILTLLILAAGGAFGYLAYKHGFKAAAAAVVAAGAAVYAAFEGLFGMF